MGTAGAPQLESQEPRFSFFFLFILLFALGSKPKALHMLGRCSTTLATSPDFFFVLWKLLRLGECAQQAPEDLVKALVTPACAGGVFLSQQPLPNHHIEA